MKIALFVHCFFPEHFFGTETYTYDLARHYQDAGHEVTVVCGIFQGEKKASDRISRYEYGGVRVVAIDKNYIPHVSVGETYYQKEMRPVLDAVLQDIRPDLVHVTHLINHTAALLEVCGMRAIPTFGTFTDFFGFCLNNKLEAADGSLCPGPSRSRANCVACHLKAVADGAPTGSVARLARRPLLSHAKAFFLTHARRSAGPWTPGAGDLVDDIVHRPDVLADLYNKNFAAAIAPTQFLQQAYRTNGINVPLHRIWFGVDVDRTPKPRRPAGRLPVVGYVGQIAPHKGTDLIIEAFGRLPPDTAELRIYGPKDQDPGFMRRLEQLAAGLPVVFKGTFPSEQMAMVLSEMDLLVIPSRWYENSPLVLLNALATHTPVLVSNVAGMTEFVDPGVNGEAFERGNVDDLEAKLRGLLGTPGQLRSMSERTDFDRGTRSMAEDTLRIYGA